MKLSTTCILLSSLTTFVYGATGGLRQKKNQQPPFHILDTLPDVPPEEVLNPALAHPLYKTFENMTDDEIDAALLERDTSYSRKLMVGHDKSFKESACNSLVESVACLSFDDFMSDKNPFNSEIKIPCGTCVTLDKFDGSLIEFPNGFNVVGKLHIPNTASVTIQTKYLLVQGVLRVDPPPAGSTLPRSGGEKVTIQLLGTDSVSFVPDGDTDNTMACGMHEDMSPKACTIGIKPFAVAGGMLTSHCRL